ncbi:hypothetical protein V6C27_02445 [Peptococcaceae bacterium 1198_IL3148]
MGSDKKKDAKKIKEIKTQVVIFKETIMKIGENIIPAPIGVKIDPKIGKIMAPIKIAPASDVVLTPKIEKGLLVNEGFVKVKMLFKNPDPEPCPDVRKSISKEVVVPIQSVHQIDCLRPGDEVKENAKIETITVMGIPDNSSPKSTGQKANLIIKVVLKIKLTILREQVIPV